MESIEPIREDTAVQAIATHFEDPQDGFQCIVLATEHGETDLTKAEAMALIRQLEASIKFFT
ncbi:hypothetical protein D881_03040 [Corynebacterium ulcerans NCTC 12077]|uniref:hypothetical protein n=1 Tax=Corynebacterium ulcerans TaxID=65058 RepID=UPI0003C7B68B|nr:hypothetical protein [Corynebacterium ulcerans]ESU58831.1 hypothetical protein D881_03040 [Corynebacterium ulcerans NCTC 12077]